MTLGFFGLGTQEILLLGLLGVGVVAIVCVFLFLTRSSAAGGRTAMLEEENRRLRDELDRAKDRPDGSPKV